MLSNAMPETRYMLTASTLLLLDEASGAKPERPCQALLSRNSISHSDFHVAHIPISNSYTGFTGQEPLKHSGEVVITAKPFRFNTLRVTLL
jgi:hypothetical protein